MCKTNAQLKGHVKGVHGERNIPCPQCGKKFKLSVSKDSLSILHRLIK